MIEAELARGLARISARARTRGGAAGLGGGKTPPAGFGGFDLYLQRLKSVVPGRLGRAVDADPALARRRAVNPPRVLSERMQVHRRPPQPRGKRGGRQVKADPVRWVPS